MFSEEEMSSIEFSPNKWLKNEGSYQFFQGSDQVLQGSDQFLQGSDQCLQGSDQFLQGNVPLSCTC